MGVVIGCQGLGDGGIVQANHTNGERKGMAEKVKINRAPVLTLWAAVVAERLGHPGDTALTLGRALAGLNAQSKGRRLGIFEPGEGSPERERGGGEDDPGPEFVALLGRQIAARRTGQGLRADEKGKPMDPASVRRYLEQKFKDDLPAVREAMQALAESLEPEDLERRGYDLYETFRPEIPEGKRGWGAAGWLDLDQIRALAKK
jgi:hypothetical protein